MLDAGDLNDLLCIAEGSQVWNHGRHSRIRRMVFKVADEFVSDAGITLEVFQHESCRLAGTHDEDRKLEQLHTDQDAFDDIAFNNQENKRSDGQ